MDRLQPDSGNRQLSAPDSELSQISIPDVIRVLWRRKFLLAGTGAAILSLAVWLILQIPHQYTATAHLMIDPVRQQVIELGRTAEETRITDQSVDDEIEVLRSRTLALAVIEEADLDRNPAFNPLLVPEQASAGGLIDFGSIFQSVVAFSMAGEAADGGSAGPGEESSALSPEAIEAELVDLFLDELSIRQIGRSRAIRISFSSQDPELAARVANAVAERYVALQLEQERNSVTQTNQWLNDSLAGLRNTVEAAEGEVERFRALSVVDGRNPETIQQQISGLNEQIITARTDYETARAELDSVEQIVRRRGLGAVFSVAPSDLADTLRTQQVSLLQRQAELSQRFGPNYPLLVAVRAELQEMARRLDAEAGGLIAAMRNTVAVAEARLRSLETSLAELQQALAEINQRDVQLRALEREAAANREILEATLDRFRSSEQVSYRPNAQILSHAVVPAEPSRPNKLFLLMGSAVGALMIGFAAVFGAEQMERGLHNPAAVDKHLQLRTIALVPDLGRRWGRRWGDNLHALESAPTDRRVIYTENLRTLATVLTLKQGQGDRTNTILLTSAEPGEGKTTLVVALAETMRRAGKSVVIIDCDLRQPEVHVRLAVPNSLGVGAYVRENAAFEEVVMRGDGARPAVIPAGPQCDDPQHILQSPRFRQMLDQAGAAFDVVLLDTPPVLPVGDVRALAPLCGQCVLVAKWRTTPRAAVDSAVRILRDAGASLSGAVLNRVNVRTYGNFAEAGSGYDPFSYRRYYRR